ncbi:MAG TPA: molybdopterin-guanine dinucleotide biosynthesis protein B [Chromatiales bacterium]|nr:molybdopterin-guanine dinucleotide biosynthesis protein B [Chromatiales bacterium]
MAADSITARCPVIGFVAASGTGKTTLLQTLIARLKARGLAIGVVKHSHHDFDIDIPGKDSYVLRKAGAGQVMVASRQRWALMTETPDRQEDPDLADLLRHLDTGRLDLVLVEGFKHEAFPKIELHRAALDHPLLYPSDPRIIAVASDTPLPDAPLPVLDLNDPDAVAGFLLTQLR